MKYIIPILIFFCSCSTTKKSKSVTKTETKVETELKVDSSTVKTTDSISVKNYNSGIITETEDDYTKETVIEFDTTKPVGYTWETPVADYFPPISRITIKEKGVKKEKQTVVANTYDSAKFTKSEVSDLTKSDKTNTVKTETVKNKDVKRTSYWGWLWLLLIPVVWIAGWYFGLWPLIPKRKKKEEYRITYKLKK